MRFDHEKLEVYQASLEFVDFVWRIAANLKGAHRVVRDQLIRASCSVPLNIAEGNAKRTLDDRNRYFEIARGSAMESAAALDVLVRQEACSSDEVEPGKALLHRVVSMLYKMTKHRQGAARESVGEYGVDEAPGDCGGAIECEDDVE